MFSAAAAGGVQAGHHGRLSAHQLNTPQCFSGQPTGLLHPQKDEMCRRGQTRKPERVGSVQVLLFYIPSFDVAVGYQGKRFLPLGWVCADIMYFYCLLFSNRPVLPHPQPALHTSQTHGQLHHSHKKAAGPPGFTRDGKISGIEPS